MTDTEAIDLSDLPSDIAQHSEKDGLAPGAWPDQVTLDEARESVERSLLFQARERYVSQSRMAEALGINQSTIARKLKRYGIA